MGRALVVTAAALLLVGCTRPAQTPGPKGSAHAELTCAACHGSGIEVTRATARVPDRACTSGGCHGGGGPTDVTLAGVSFRHRQHGHTGRIQGTCAGCHTHAGNVREKRLAASGDACALCHADQLAGRHSTDCRACHQDPRHVPRTSQGVPIPHSSLPTLETGCLRCHYDVEAPRMAVSTSRCAGCHDSPQLPRGIGTDLHPEHAGVACTSCHEGASHRVVAMSSAVVLDCRDCHRIAHEVKLTEMGGNPSATCNGCHGQTHQAQQRLVLGEVPGMAPNPAMKFATGMTCRSCHTDGAGASATPVRGQAAACSGCHRPEYTQVLHWWLTGSGERLASVGAYVRSARDALGAGAPAATRSNLQSAADMLAVVREGGGEHNLELSDAIFRESVARVRTAYRLAGRGAPAAPGLGTVPHVGFCSYCHYSTEDPWDFDRMPAAFHKAVLDTMRVTAAQAPAR